MIDKDAATFIELALQCTDAQFKKFCDKMQEEFKDTSTEEYTKWLQMIKLLDALRNEKGA